MIKRVINLVMLFYSMTLFAGNEITCVPESLNSEDRYYSKYLNANGIPVLASENVDDKALIAAKGIIVDMLSKDKKVANYMSSNGCKVMIIGHKEEVLDLPEYRHLATTQEERDFLNKRARGFGGAPEDGSAASCGEENLIFLDGDRYVGENILIHEFAHLIHLAGLNIVYDDFDSRLEALFIKAKSNKLWENTYAMENKEEYFAEAVQSFFNANRYSNPTNGIHGQLSDRKSLKKGDKEMYDFLCKYFKKADKVYCVNPNEKQ